MVELADTTGLRPVASACEFKSHYFDYLCYKLKQRRNPYASEFEVAVGWGPTDVSEAFIDRNYVAM